MRVDLKSEEPYRISRDKMNVLARAVTEALAGMEGVEFVEDKNTVRLEARRLLEELLAQEKKIDLSARRKIESQ